MMLDPRAGGTWDIQSRVSQVAGTRDPEQQRHCDDACAETALVMGLYSQGVFSTPRRRRYHLCLEKLWADSQHNLTALPWVVGYQRHANSKGRRISLSRIKILEQFDVQKWGYR